MTDVRDFILGAIETGNTVEIIYMGGSQPGSLRKIAPLSINGDKLRAKCYAANAVKTFSVSKMVQPKDSNARDYKLGTTTLEQYSTLYELYEAVKDSLIGMGWHLETGKDFLRLYARFKNGNLKKSPSVELVYQEMTWDLVIGTDGIFREENHRPKQRPWTVYSKSSDTRTFTHLTKASEFLMSEADKLK